jgi:Fe-S-cluster-containing dehydrogenase component
MFCGCNRNGARNGMNVMPKASESVSGEIGCTICAHACQSGARRIHSSNRFLGLSVFVLRVALASELVEHVDRNRLPVVVNGPTNA